MMPGWSAAPSATGISQQATPASYAYPASQSLPDKHSATRNMPLTIVLDPAFTPVQVRNGFAQYIPAATPTYGGHVSAAAPAQSSVASTAPSASSPPEPSKAKVEWPDSVRSYVQRSFLPQNDEPTVSRADIEAKLKATIGSARENGTLYTINWDTMPLPQAMVKSEREAQFKQTSNHGLPLNSKKRKSGDFTHDEHHQPNWSPTNHRSSLGDRVSYPSPDKYSSDEPLKSSKFQREANKRKRRFENEYKAVVQSPSSPPPTSGPIVGTSEVLEKKYLRLTAPPVASNVRPERILRQTLDLLKKKWRKESNYSYICDQFKSMRQDLTVQRIKNEFTVSVYEIHARIALEKGDIGEYNQCQTQLRSLYTLGLKGNPIEFKAYRILYFIHTANRTGMNDTLADLTVAEKEERPIKHALDVRSALALGNYHKFFQLYMDTPNMGAYLMDMFVVRERLAALCNLCKAFKPDVKLRFITEELGFESDADAAQFIIDYQGQHLLEDRQEYIAFLTGKAGALFESARSSAFQKVDIKGQI
ncbi:hypothetical protein S40288_00406 [Stachybotrys chartarum IBT 40288]|nr:hypothetical protein S40288_00406 [Stachybotrys chartarum IBT 40288]